MATTPNQKPVPSEDYANMRFNAGKLDEFMTSTASSYVDRLGVTHLTVEGIQASVTGALLPANNLSDVQSAATSRTNLGLGTVAVESTVPIAKGGTGASTAAAALTALGAKANAGVTNASVAAAGVVGQVITATGTATTMTTGTQADILTMILTAGDWDLDAAIRIAPTGTTITQVVASTATTALATTVFPNRLIFGFNSQASIEVPFPTKTVNISATTTIYLSLSVAFSGGSATGQGYMSARRVR